MSALAETRADPLPGLPRMDTIGRLRSSSPNRKSERMFTRKFVVMRLWASMRC
jgi:hypothetical protein